MVQPQEQRPSTSYRLEIGIIITIHVHVYTCVHIKYIHLYILCVFFSK